MNQEQRIEYFMSEIARLSNQVVDLQNERDALAAQVEALRDAGKDAAESLGFLSHHLRGRMGEAALIDMAEKADALSEALKATPQHHLAELRAGAGQKAHFDGYMLGYEHAMTNKAKCEPAIYAQQYADQIRKGEV